MNIGDLVKMTNNWRGNYGCGFVISITSGAGYTVCVLFPDSITSSFDGYKWCQEGNLEVVSECR